MIGKSMVSNNRDSGECRRGSVDAVIETQGSRGNLVIPDDDVGIHGTANTKANPPMATIIACLNDGTNKKPIWLHRRCLVYDGHLILTSFTESLSNVIQSAGKTFTSPLSLCNGSWSYPLNKCRLCWSDITSTDLESIRHCGILDTSQLYPRSCTVFSPFCETLSDPSSEAHVCRIFFLQRENLPVVLKHIKEASSTLASSMPQQHIAQADLNSASVASSITSLLSGKDKGVKSSFSGTNCGIAGPAGAFPLMVAAETLAASFGIHVARSHLPTSFRSPYVVIREIEICSDPHGTCPNTPHERTDLHEISEVDKEVLHGQPHDPHHTQHAPCVANKGNILRHTFAKMRQAASSVGFSTSSSSPGYSPGSNTTSPIRKSVLASKGFQQRLLHFSQSSHETSSYQQQQKQPEGNEASIVSASRCRSLPNATSRSQVLSSQQTDVASAHIIGARIEPEVTRPPSLPPIKSNGTLLLPLTASLEPTNSALESFNYESDLVPVNAHELAVTSPMQLAIVESSAFTQSSPECVSVTEVEPPMYLSSDPFLDRTVFKSSLPTVTASSLSANSQGMTKTSSTSQTVKEAVLGTTKRFLRRPTEPSLNVGVCQDDPNEVGALQPVRHPQRCLMGAIPLHKCPRSTESALVPFVVELCVTLVERFGLNCVGIYRVSGNKVAHDFISSELCKTIDELDTTSGKWNDIHAVSCVLKTFLRNLPDSLIPKVMYPEFLAASRLEAGERRLLSVQRLLSIMECYVGHPEYRAHRATLRYLAMHLSRVAARQAVNRMTAYNLALVFAPNVVQPSEDSPELFIADSNVKIWLVKTIINHHKWLFSPDLGIESGGQVPDDSDDVFVGEELGTSTGAVAVNGAGLPQEAKEQPGRVEGDVRPILRELLNAAALLPPPPSESDMESAEDPGSSSDRPMTTVHVSRSSVMESFFHQSQSEQMEFDPERSLTSPASGQSQCFSPQKCDVDDVAKPGHTVVSKSSEYLSEVSCYGMTGYPGLLPDYSQNLEISSRYLCPHSAPFCSKSDPSTPNRKKVSTEKISTVNISRNTMYTTSLTIPRSRGVCRPSICQLNLPAAAKRRPRLSLSADSMVGCLFRRFQTASPSYERRLPECTASTSTKLHSVTLPSSPLNFSVSDVSPVRLPDDIQEEAASELVRRRWTQSIQGRSRRYLFKRMLTFGGRRVDSEHDVKRE